MVGGYKRRMEMPRKSTKKPEKPEKIAQPEPETPAPAAAEQAPEKKKDPNEVRVNIKLTSELYQIYQREAQEHAMPAASLMAYALKEYADSNFVDAVPVLDAAQVAAAAAIAAQMMGEKEAPQDAGNMRFC